MCDHPDREAAMVVLRRDDEGTPTVWCDPCIAELVDALNTNGLTTIASCCGHGHRPGVITLADGRCLLVCADQDEALTITSSYPDINGVPGTWGQA